MTTTNPPGAPEDLPPGPDYLTKHPSTPVDDGPSTPWPPPPPSPPRLPGQPPPIDDGPPSPWLPNDPWRPGITDEQPSRQPFLNRLGGWMLFVIIFGVLALAGAGVAVYKLYDVIAGAGTFAVGDCVTTPESAAYGNDILASSCSASDAWRVQSVHDGVDQSCSTWDSTYYTDDVTTFRDHTTNTTYCIAPASSSSSGGSNTY